MRTRSSRTAIVVACTALAALAGCEDPRGNDWQQVKALEERVAQLEQELDECRNGPARLLATARAAMDKRDYPAALAAAQNLVTWHPHAPEAADAEDIIRLADAALAEAQAQKDAAAARLAQEAEAARAQALRRLTGARDDKQGVTYYRHKGAPEYLNARSVLSPYIVVNRSGQAYLMLRNVYVAKEALEIDSVKVTADGAVFEYPESFQRDADDVAHWEWSEGTVGARQREMLAAVSTAGSAVIRYEGKNGSVDRAINAAEKSMIAEVLEAYGALSMPQ